MGHVVGIGGFTDDSSQISKQRHELIDRVLEFVDEDHEKFLKRIRERIDR